MDRNRIALNEVMNDGRTIWLYFDGMAGVYLAYGLSAYYVTMVTDVMVSYSNDMQMPVALLCRNDVQSLGLHTEMMGYEPEGHLRFQMKRVVGEDGYDTWAAKCREAVTD